MRSCIPVLVTIGLLTLCITLSAIASAGPLDPPAAPAPTYKTLDEVEARIPIRQADIPLTIAQSGSYYLVENITVSAFTAAAIHVTPQARVVTIDLNGFFLSAEPGTMVTGIYVEPPFAPESRSTGVVIRNGAIGGFQGQAIFATRANAHFSDLTITGCGNGIVVGDHPGAVVRNCTIVGIGGPDAMPDTAVQGHTVGMRLGTGALVEDCLVRDGALRDGGNQGLIGIWVTQGGVVRNTRVIDMVTSHGTTNLVVGIRASIGSIVEGCSLNNIGSETGTAFIVRGIWANQSTVRDNLIRGIRNFDRPTRGIESIDSSRVVRNHVMEISGFSVYGILAEREGFGSAVIEDNVVRGLKQIPFGAFEIPVGIVNRTDGGSTQGNSLEIDEPTHAGIAVLGRGHQILSNTISFPTGVVGFPGAAIIVRIDSSHTYVAGNVGILCTLVNNGIDTILGTTPAPNHFGP